MVEQVMVDQSRDQPLLRLEENCYFHSTRSFRLRPDSPLFVSQLQLKRRVVFLLKFTYILGYAWFPQKEGYQCPPDTNTVNRGGSDEPLFVKVESQ